MSERNWLISIETPQLILHSGDIVRAPRNKIAGGARCFYAPEFVVYGVSPGYRFEVDAIWSQEELAFHCNIHRTYISGLERGIRNPTISVVARLAKTLKVPFGALMDPPARKSR